MPLRNLQSWPPKQQLPQQLRWRAAVVGDGLEGSDFRAVEPANPSPNRAGFEEGPPAFRGRFPAFHSKPPAFKPFNQPPSALSFAAFQPISPTYQPCNHPAFQPSTFRFPPCRAFSICGLLDVRLVFTILSQLWLGHGRSWFADAPEQTLDMKRSMPF